VIVHEAPKTCGFGAELSATIAEEAILYLKSPILRVTGYDVVIPLPKLEDYYLPSVERVRKSIEEVMRY
jgi:pyruvate dehydrogenase E1 component beta subunit